MIDAKLLVEKAYEAQKFAYTPYSTLMLVQPCLVQTEKYIWVVI